MLSRDLKATVLKRFLNSTDPNRLEPSPQCRGEHPSPTSDYPPPGLEASASRVRGRSQMKEAFDHRPDGLPFMYVLT